MILKIIEGLKTISQKLNEDDIALIGFTPNINNEIEAKMLKKGWWHVLFFGSNDYFQYGLRIIPWKKFDEWPVVLMNDFYSSSTIAPNISKALPFIRYRNLIDDQEFFDLIKDEWVNYINATTSIVKLIKAENNINDFKVFMFDQMQRKSPISESISDKYLKFWNHFDQSPEQNKMRFEIDNMIKDKNYLPILESSKDYGIWQTRLIHLFASRVTFNSLKMLIKRKQTALLISAFDEPLCYDCEYVSVSQLPNQAIDASISSFDLAEQIVTVDEPLIKTDPLFQVMEELVNKGEKQYSGIEHAEAAAIFDDKLNQPKRSWNALISCAYWSGKNSDETFLPVLEIAIYLCKKHGWKDAISVLNHQLKIIKS